MKTFVSVRVCGRVLAVLLASASAWPVASSHAGAGAQTCSVLFTLDDPTPLGAIQYEVDYSASGGAFVGADALVSCSGNVSPALFAANDDEGAQTLTLGTIALEAFTGPTPLATCQFTSVNVPDVADLAITVMDDHPADTFSGFGNECGAPRTGSSPPYTRDALTILQAAVGMAVACDPCECDTDDNASITASDSLRSLRKAVGQPVAPLNCPACVGPPVVTAASASVSVSVSLSCGPCGNGTLDAGEQCDDSNNEPGDCCASDCTFEAAASGCDDGDACGDDECDGAGACIAGTGAQACDDGFPCTVDTCNVTCVNTLGVDAPCSSGAKSALLVTDSTDDGKDSIKWKLTGGPATDQADLGDPVTTAAYTLCVFDSTGGVDALAADLTFGPGVEWTSKDPKGASYKDPTGADEGVTKAVIKTGLAGKSKFLVQAKGLNLPMPAPAGASEFFDQDTKVTVQLRNDETSACWGAEFTTATLNTLEKFKAKTP